MVVVKKKSQQHSAQDLINGIEKFAVLLETQDEVDAASDLRTAAASLKNSAVSSAEFKGAIDAIVEAFDGDHELRSYTFRRANKDDKGWSIADELFLASTNVLNLVKRFSSSALT